MTNPITISSVDGDTKYNLTLTQTDDTSAILDLWKSVAGVDSDETYNLVDVAVTGTKATCQTQVLFAMATVEIDIGAAEVDITVSHIWFAPTIPPMPISSADRAALVAWLNGFPQGAS
jgi:hypothetical protein